MASKLAGLFTALIHHGHTAQCIRDSIIQPIPKSAKGPAKSANYRGIALTFFFSKLLELSILLMFPEYFNTSCLKSGFKKGSIQIYGTLKIVASHYVQWESKVSQMCLCFAGHE